MLQIWPAFVPLGLFLVLFFLLFDPTVGIAYLDKTNEIRLMLSLLNFESSYHVLLHLIPDSTLGNVLSWQVISPAIKFHVLAGSFHVSFQRVSSKLLRGVAYRLMGDVTITWARYTWLMGEFQCLSVA